MLEVGGINSLPDQFSQVATKVYAADPNWIPEDPQSLKSQFDARNAWFDGNRRACVVMAADNARLAGFIPNQVINDEPVAFFGFWETINDLAINQALFAQIEDWARSHGAKRLYGPINFNTFGANRLRLDTFDLGCFPGEPYNPPYYPVLMERLGFSCGMGYQSYPVNINEFLAKTKEARDKYQPDIEANFTIESLTPKMWLDNLEEFYSLVEQIFRDNFAYSPISFEAFRSVMGESFARKFCSYSSVLAKTKDGRIAGFFIAIPDYAPLVRQGNPQRIAQSAFSFDEHFEQLPQPRAVLAKSVGVHPDFRRGGLSNFLGLELSARAQPYYETVIGALIRDDNHSAKFPDRFVFDRRKYGLFNKAL